MSRFLFSFFILHFSFFIPFILSVPASAQDYKMAGPYEVVARDGQFRASKGGSERDMKAAWDFAREGKRQEARRIIDAYADKLQRLDGHDAPLCLIQGYWLCRAMIELRDNPSIINPPLGPKGRFTLEESTIPSSWDAMLRRAFVPTMNQFEADSPYANGNWGAIVNRFRMACAIALGDSAMYSAAIDYFLHAYDNGSLPRYVSPSGQCQETGRDQAHAQLGLGALADICEMAWEQGDDLWGALDNRLMHGLEYTARYNLGYDVPFQTWTDCTGLYNEWTEPGAMGRGTIRDIYQAAYNHYVGRRHLKMPYTKRVLDLQKKAEKRGELKRNPEADHFQVQGVKEGQKLHQVFTYPAPKGAPLKHDYDVFVQPRGAKEWTKVDTYMAKVNASVGNRKHAVSEISYCLFDFTGDVLVKVVSKNRKFKSARIRPHYRGVIANVQNDSTVQFLLFQPENLSVELSPATVSSPLGEDNEYSITDNLLVFTSKPPISKEEAEAQAKAQGRRFIYCPPGFYEIKDNRLEIKDKRLEIKDSLAQSSLISHLSSLISNTTLYLAPGSYFTGTFAIEDVHDVSILGRGIARPTDGYQGAHVYRSKNVLIDGLVLNTCPIGESHGVTLHDVRSISHPSWGDGLNVFGGSSDILLDRVFCRNSDDCTTAYATRKGFSGSTRNVTMRNSTLWADLAHPIFIGIHGNSERGDTVEHLRYENIDILGQAEPQVDYQGCLAINCGDNNLVRDVIFDNVRIENIEDGSIAQVKVSYNQKYCTAPGRAVQDVTFRGVRYNGSIPQSLAIINGYDADHRVQNVTFEGLKINGQLIYDDMPGKPRWYATADYIPMYVGNHTSGVVFTKDINQFNVKQQLAYCSSQVDRALAQLRPYDFTLMPRNILSGQSTWNLRKATPQEWCSGFWPGILWMAYEYNKSEAVHKAAAGYTDAILPVIAQPVFDHDLGFITINALLKAIEQLQGGSQGLPSHLNLYRQAALQAADSLATLFNPVVGTILSWPRHVKDYGGHNTIMDNMMNLELLFWASQQLGNDHGRQLYDIAVRHAETTMKNHFRKDGSCYHVAVYDTLTGNFIRGVTHQGYSDQSMWSRGQAWAIYGYTMVYRYTHDPRFLLHAQKVADIYLKRLHERSVLDGFPVEAPDDNVPFWDMDDPEIGQLKKLQLDNGNDRDDNCKIANRKMVQLKDASAAAVVASALLELCQYDVSGERETVNGKSVHRKYYEAAVAMLGDLSTERYQSRNRNVAFLLHSTGHRPAGSEIDASIVYADYYYIEALLRYNRFFN